MSNEAALIVIVAIWLASGRGLNLCLLIIAYYSVYLLASPQQIHDYFLTDLETSVSTYAVQASVDTLALTGCAYLSLKNKKIISIYLAYGAIIATSLVLNGLMLYDQMIDLSNVYQLHAIRQEFSIPFDVLFAVLGSAAGGQAYYNHYLRPFNAADYNRSNHHY